MHGLEDDHPIGPSRAGRPPQTVERIRGVHAHHDGLRGHRGRLGPQVDSDVFLVPVGDEPGHRFPLSGILDERHLSGSWSEIHPKRLLSQLRKVSHQPPTDTTAGPPVHRIWTPDR